MIANLGQLQRQDISIEGRMPIGFGPSRASGRAAFEISLVPRPVAHLVGFASDLCDRISSLLGAESLETRRHAHFRAYVARDRGEPYGCTLVRASAISAQAVDTLAGSVHADTAFPWIIVAEQADLETAVRAMKAGAIDVLAGSFEDCTLIESVERALEAGNIRRSRAMELERTAKRFRTLTQREREIMAYVVKGLMNKQIAGDLGISEITVKMHRGAVMRKMMARTLVDLVRMADVVDGLQIAGQKSA